LAESFLGKEKPKAMPLTMRNVDTLLKINAKEAETTPHQEIILIKSNNCPNK